MLPDRERVLRWLFEAPEEGGPRVAAPRIVFVVGDASGDARLPGMGAVLEDRLAAQGLRPVPLSTDTSASSTRVARDIESAIESAIESTLAAVERGDDGAAPRLALVASGTATAGALRLLHRRPDIVEAAALCRLSRATLRAHPPTVSVPTLLVVGAYAQPEVDLVRMVADRMGPAARVAVVARASRALADVASRYDAATVIGRWLRQTLEPKRPRRTLAGRALALAARVGGDVGAHLTAAAAMARHRAGAARDLGACRTNPSQ